ncbi:DnaK family protein [Spatholobus suberectus]|nr:DnaK family protein [Spatholobus suberectus]
MHRFPFSQDLHIYLKGGHALILLKNSVGETKMKKDIRTCCYGEGSTSTLNKQNNTTGNSNQCQVHFPSKVSSPTLQDLMLQFELESKLGDDFGGTRGRMSCVNDSNILRSTRKGLNQYPRLSVDGGRDALYRSSFGNTEGRRSVCYDRRLRGGLLEESNDLGSRFDKGMSLPHTLAGESVVWCKPGVVARLMGLEAIPLPVNSIRSDSKEKILAVFRMQNPRRRF